MGTEMSLDETIAGLNDTVPLCSEDKPFILAAITLLERVKRLEDLINIAEGKTCACGQIHRRVFSAEILKYLQTGEEW